MTTALVGSIESHGVKMDRAGAGSNVGFRAGGVTGTMVGRGSVIGDVGACGGGRVAVDDNGCVVGYRLQFEWS
jgi:translation elongation factor EF-Tu-like GTPase